MHYQTFDPSETLKPFINCYWILESPAETIPEKQRIVPDGCMEMIFHYGDLYRQYLNENNSIVQPRCFVIGQLTTPLYIQATGKTGIFSVRFHPGGFSPFSSYPLKEMENTAIALEKIFGELAAPLEEKILSANDPVQQITIIEQFLTERMLHADNVDRLVKSTVDTMLTINGQISIDELSQQMQVHRKQLERKFSTAVGLSPKQLSKIIRLQATLKLLVNNRVTSLTALAHEADYYDQAHFIKDFKEFTGVSPKKFFSNNLKMSSLFSGTD